DQPCRSRTKRIVAGLELGIPGNSCPELEKKRVPGARFRPGLGNSYTAILSFLQIRAFSTPAAGPARDHDGGFEPTGAADVHDLPARLLLAHRQSANESRGAVARLGQDERKDS